MMEEFRYSGTLLMSRAREEAAFLKAFDEHADALFRHAYFRLSDRERAKDVVQDTFVKAWDYIEGGSEIGHWKGFLYRVLNNLIVDEYRHKKERSLDALLEEDPSGALAHIGFDSRGEREERLDQELLIERVRALIPELPEQLRLPLVLRYVDGLSPKEISRSLGITENAVSVRIHRAVAHLKKLCDHLTDS